MKQIICFEEMDREYAAWQTVVMECRRLEIDMNQPKYDRLIRAICVWGERLHALRANQRADQIESALKMYEAQYNKVKKDNP